MLLEHASTGQRMGRMKAILLGAATAVLGTFTYVMIGIALASGG
jgi:hypothetical protein